MDKSGDDQSGAEVTGPGIDDVVALSQKLAEVANNARSVSDSVDYVLHGNQAPVTMAPAPPTGNGTGFVQTSINTNAAMVMLLLIAAALIYVGYKG